jgi:hypothetical protein
VRILRHKNIIRQILITWTRIAALIWRYCSIHLEYLCILFFFFLWWICCVLLTFRDEKSIPNLTTFNSKLLRVKHSTLGKRTIEKIRLRMYAWFLSFIRILFFSLFFAFIRFCVFAFFFFCFFFFFFFSLPSLSKCYQTFNHSNHRNNFVASCSVVSHSSSLDSNVNLRARTNCTCACANLFSRMAAWWCLSIHSFDPNIQFKVSFFVEILHFTFFRSFILFTLVGFYFIFLSHFRVESAETQCLTHAHTFWARAHTACHFEWRTSHVYLSRGSGVTVDYSTLQLADSLDWAGLFRCEWIIMGLN